MTIRSRDKSRYVSRCINIIACILFACMLMTQTAWGDGKTGENKTADHLGLGDDYAAIVYDHTNGLPTSEANDVAETSEGFIWIACYSGLYRYDGNDFVRVDYGVSSAVELLVDRKDRLWVATNDSGLAMIEKDSCRKWRKQDGLCSDKICSITEADDGTIYVGTTTGICVVSDDFKVSIIDDPKLTNVYADKLTTGNDGTIYGITNEDDVFIIRDGKLDKYIEHTGTVVKNITCIRPDPDNDELLYFSGENGLYHGKLESSPQDLESTDISPLVYVYDIEKLGDEIWLSASNGIGVIDSEGFHYLKELPFHSSVKKITADYEGNLWFSSTRSGVMKLVANRFCDLFSRCGIPQSVVNSTCMYNGELFVGTDEGLIVINGEEPVASVPLYESVTASGEPLGFSDLLQTLRDTRIRSIIRDSKNRLWISTWQGPGLIRYENGKMTVFSEKDGLMSDYVRTICENDDGSVLVVCSGGLNVINGNEVTDVITKADGVTNSENLCACIAPNGDILVGSNGNGIYIINDEGIRNIDTDDGLSSGIIMHIKYDAVRKLFWVIASNSITYLNEDYGIVTVNSFPYSNNFDLYENSRGDMWVLSSNGIYVIPVTDLVANQAAHPVYYGITNGMTGLPTGNSYSAVTDDGNLYISCNTGVIRVNMDESMERIYDIRQAVPFVKADDKVIYPDKSGTFRIPVSTHKLTIYYYAFDYSMTDPQVSYRLLGFDSETVTMRQSELEPIVYTNLHGGNYLFQGVLTDAMGRGKKTMTVSIVKAKALYEQTWFYVLFGSIAAMLLNFIFWTVVRNKTKALEKKHIEESERERVQNELQMARQIQASALPHEFPPFKDRPEFDIYAEMKPAREVGGDFYDFFLIDEDHLCLVIADVSGKGVPAALFMMNSKVTLQGKASGGKTVSEILTGTNEALCDNNEMEMFVSVWLGILEISTGKMVCGNAGHEYPAIYRSGGRFDLLKDKHGLVLGGMEGITYSEYELKLDPGDKVFVYTDGIPEASDSSMNMFGTERMVDALNSDPEASPGTLVHNVRDAVSDFVKGAEQFDDLTMLCMVYHGSGSLP